MLGMKRSAPRLLGTKAQRVDLIGAKVQIHDPKADHGHKGEPKKLEK